jgi:hypothetical protein
MTKEESWKMISDRNELRGCVSMRIPVRELQRVHDMAFDRGAAHAQAQAAMRADDRPDARMPEPLRRIFGMPDEV